LLLTAELFILQKYCISCDQYQKNSGQKYIENVIEKGIDTIITEHQIDNSSINQIITKNSVEFLQTLAKYHFEHSDINSIGITGSNGKTILKEWFINAFLMSL
jgi:alanine racemase